MLNIQWDECGYTDACVVCEGFCDRDSEKANGWIRRMLTNDKGNNLRVAELRKGENIEEAKKSHLIPYDIIVCKPSDPRKKIYLANKHGIRKLAEIASGIGKRAAEASRVLVALEEAQSSQVLPARDTESTSSNDALVEDGLGEDGIPDLDDLLANYDELADVKSLKELNDKNPKSASKIFYWYGQEVILASAYAAFCDRPVAPINGRIKKYSQTGKMVDGIDFFHLSTKDDVRIFLKSNNVDLPSDETKKGLYLLTQVGFNNLSGRLRSEKAEALRVSANLAASITQKLQRPGASESNKVIAAIICAIKEENSKILASLEEARATNTALIAKLISLETRPVVVDSGQVKGIVEDVASKFISTQIYGGEKELPPHLIGNKERREVFFPGINSSIVSRYLENRGHKGELWKKPNDSYGPENRYPLLDVYSYHREGMFERSEDFFKELTYEKATPLYLVFNLKNTGVSEQDTIEIRRFPGKSNKDEDRYILKELARFIGRFIRAHPSYIYEPNSRTLSSAVQVSLF